MSRGIAAQCKRANPKSPACQAHVMRGETTGARRVRTRAPAFASAGERTRAAGLAAPRAPWPVYDAQNTRRSPSVIARASRQVEPRVELRASRNLSSIVLLAEVEGHRVLLSGDAGAQQILDGLERAGVLRKGGRCEVDIFKLPHHGSIRNITAELLDRVRAKHYVISANGSNGNPDEDTLALLGDVLDGDQTICVTFAHDDWKTIRATGKTAQARIEALQNAQHWLDQQRVKVVYRDPHALGIAIPLDAA